MKAVAVAFGCEPLLACAWPICITCPTLPSTTEIAHDVALGSALAPGAATPGAGFGAATAIKPANITAEIFGIISSLQRAACGHPSMRSPDRRAFAARPLRDPRGQPALFRSHTLYPRYRARRRSARP